MKQIWNVTLLAMFMLAATIVGQNQVQASEIGAKLGNPTAPKGGTFYVRMPSEPTTLNPFTSTDLYSSQIQGYVLDTLMTRHSDTYEWTPALAESYKISKDGLSYTFKIREGVKWHDGKPLTIEDVKFSFDAIRDKAYKAFRSMPYYENFTSAEVVDKHTITFKANKKYFGNFNVVAGMLQIVPKHIYKDPKKRINKTLIGSGPYILHKYNKGKAIILKRNKDWWGTKTEFYKSMHNAGKLYFRFVKEDNVALEMLKKGRIDYAGLTPEEFEQKTKGAPWGKTVLKKKVINNSPKGYGFIAWNFKNKLFQEKKTRVALAHLMNRELMNKKFRFGMSLLATGPWYQQSPYASKKVKPIKFDPKKAAKLLKKVGWKDSDKDGVLDKKINGKLTPFKFSLMFSRKDSEKYYTLYQEDLKKAGIAMELKLVDWNSFVKALDEKKFDAVTLGWSAGSVENDPKQIWHSESSRAGGSNFISYSNKKVDKLIDKGRQELDRNKRIKMYQKIYEEIANEAPYVFMFNEKYGLYAHNKKMKQPKETFNYTIGRDYWWIQK